MKLPVPPEPRKIGFQPETSFLGFLFRNDVARSIWLLVSHRHVVGEDDTPAWCLRLADHIEQRRPGSPTELFEMIERLNSSPIRGHRYVDGTFEEVEEFVTRMFEAVTGARPVEYRVILPGTPEWEAMMPR